MFSFHKPKIYRSLTGCCICRAKSSSSRFTDSGKYQPYFGACFHLKEERSGDICNACVLLVKRFRKLPSGVQHRHWGHVVDARANTKVRSKMSIAEKVDVEEDDETTSVVAAEDDDDEILTLRKKKKKLRDKEKQQQQQQHQHQQPRESGGSRCWNHRPHKVLATKLEINPMPSFLDPQLWRRETVCCGTIFRGPMNAVVIDTNYFRPCESRRRLMDHGSSDQTGSSAGTSSPSSSNSPSASLSPASASPTTSTEIHFKMDSAGDDQRSECDSETNFDDRNFADRTGQNSHSKMAVPAAL